MKYDYDYVKVSADYVKKIVPYEPEIGIILGSGLGKFADSIENPVEIKYSDIPNFLVSTVASHAGKLIFGRAGGKNGCLHRFGSECSVFHENIDIDLPGIRHVRDHVRDLGRYLSCEEVISAPGTCAGITVER